MIHIFWQFKEMLKIRDRAPSRKYALCIVHSNHSICLHEVRGVKVLHSVRCVKARPPATFQGDFLAREQAVLWE